MKFCTTSAAERPTSDLRHIHTHFAPPAQNNRLNLLLDLEENIRMDTRKCAREAALKCANCFHRSTGAAMTS